MEKTIDDIIYECADKSGMSMTRYLRTYKPIADTNECCMTCKNACGGCEWSKSFEPVSEWVARPTIISHGNKHCNSVKIYYCPEYISDEERASFYDNEAALRLFEGIILSASDGYKKAMDAIQACRIKLKSSNLSDKELSRITNKYSYALRELTIGEFMLPKWIIKKMREDAKYTDDAELNAEMASCPPSKNIFW